MKKIEIFSIKHKIDLAGITKNKTWFSKNLSLG